MPEKNLLFHFFKAQFFLLTFPSCTAWLHWRIPKSSWLENPERADGEADGAKRGDTELSHSCGEMPRPFPQLSFIQTPNCWLRKDRNRAALEDPNSRFYLSTLLTAQLISRFKGGCPALYFQAIHCHRHTQWTPGEEGGPFLHVSLMSNGTIEPLQRVTRFQLYHSLSRESFAYQGSQPASQQEDETTVSHAGWGHGKQTHTSFCVEADCGNKTIRVLERKATSCLEKKKIRDPSKMAG